MANTPRLWTSELESAYTAELRNMALYEGQHEAYLHLDTGGWKWPIYILRNHLARMTDTYGTFVWRKFPYLETTNKEMQESLDRIIEACHIWQLVTSAQERISAAGSATFKLNWSIRNSAPILRLWGTQEGEYAAWECESGGYDPYAVSFYWLEERRWGSACNPVKIRVKQRFEISKGTVNVTVQAQREDKDGTPVLLTVLYPDDPAKQIPAYNMPGTQLPAYRVLNGVAAKSDYTKTMLSHQRSVATNALLKYIGTVLSSMPQLDVPPEMLDANGNVDLARMLVTIKDGDFPESSSAITAKLVGNDFNLANAEKLEQSLNEDFYRLTGISPALDGFASGSGGDSGYARRLGMIKTDAAIESRRRAWDGFWNWLGTAVPECAAYNKDTSWGAPIDGISATWTAPIPPDTDAESQSIERGVRASYISRESAIRRVNPDWTEQQVIDEIARIADEIREATARQMESFSVIPGE